jgi:hypothetical protein
MSQLIALLVVVGLTGAASPEAALLAEQRAEVASVDVLHRKVEPPLVVGRGERRDDMGIVEARGELRLAEEATPEALVLRRRRVEQLQRDRLPCIVARAVYLGHRTSTDERLDAVAREARARRQFRVHLVLRIANSALDLQT